MKSFLEFMGSINEDAFANLVDQQIPPQFLIGEIKQEDFPTALSFIYQKAVRDSVRLSLAYLEAYHEWLDKQT